MRLSPEASGAGLGCLTSVLRRSCTLGDEDSDDELGDRRRRTLDSEAGVRLRAVVVVLDRERDLEGVRSRLLLDRSTDLLRPRVTEDAFDFGGFFGGIFRNGVQPKKGFGHNIIQI